MHQADNPPDPTGGYDAVADGFIQRRLTSDIGAATVRTWARSLAPGATVLDLGCGAGVPISRTLHEAGLVVYGIDASPRMTAAFRQQLPGVPIATERVEQSRFFDRCFDAVVAWGLIFLLPADAQTALIGRIAPILRPGGRFLFTAPAPACSWTDVLTGRLSQSLGAVGYRAALRSAGLIEVAEYEDEGENHYFDAGREGWTARGQ